MNCCKKIVVVLKIDLSVADVYDLAADIGKVYH